MTPDTLSLVERLELRARVSFDFNASHGRRGKEWAIETEIEWQAAARIRDLEQALSALVDSVQADVKERDSRMTVGTLHRVEEARQALTPDPEKKP